jgi:putative membrane protein
MKNPFKSMPIDEKFIREHLALERTKLANERTLLSYTQAALYFLLGGLALFQLKEYVELRYIGYLALFFSGLFFIIGIWRYLSLKRKMKNLLRPYKNPVTEEKKEENPL